jgi:radical SAM protein with 4Fe4S-binding SPASM domain
MDNLRACYYNNLLTAENFICHIIDTATIAPNGDVINCIHIRKPFGNVLDAPFEEIWNSEGANAFRRELLKNNLTPLCENCPFMSPAPRKIARKIQSQVVSVRVLRMKNAAICLRRSEGEEAFEV